MLKLQTPVEISPSHVGVSLHDSIVVLGSCFADNIGERLLHAGFDACVNPFGTLYNPVSLANAVARLSSGVPFSERECVEMGAGAGLICSFSHHTSFARPTAAEFLDAANSSLALAHEKWTAATRVILTLGTVYTFVHEGEVVANCLKRPAAEFDRLPLSLDQTVAVLSRIVASNPDKEFIFTVSPVRHMADGAHGNQLSKSTLLLAVEEVVKAFPLRCAYFPAYEILLDELRDYRFYADDMSHPSPLAVSYIWERFCDAAVPASERGDILAGEKAWRASQHKKMLKV